MITIEYVYLLDDKWTRVRLEVARGQDGKVHVATPPGAVLDMFWMKEVMVPGEHGIVRTNSFMSPWCFTDVVVFDDPTVLDRTYAWMAANRAVSSDDDEEEEALVAVERRVRAETLRWVVGELEAQIKELRQDWVKVLLSAGHRSRIIALLETAKMCRKAAGRGKIRDVDDVQEEKDPST